MAFMPVQVLGSSCQCIAINIANRMMFLKYFQIWRHVFALRLSLEWSYGQGIKKLNQAKNRRTAEN